MYVYHLEVCTSTTWRYVRLSLGGMYVYHLEVCTSICTYFAIEDCSNVNLVRVCFSYTLLQRLSALKRLVPHVHIIFQSEGELTMAEHLIVTCLIYT